MVFVLLLVMAAVTALYWLGTITLIPAAAGVLAAIVSLAFVLVGRYRHVSLLARRIKELRAKWGGALSLVFGLPTPVDQRYYFFLSRKDELIIESKLFSETIPLSDINYALVLNGHTLLAYNETDLMKAAMLPERPSLVITRNWLRRHQAEQHCQLLLLWPTVDTRREKNLGDVIVLIDDNQLGDLDGLLRRPEIAVKTTVLGDRRKKLAKSAPKSKERGQNARDEQVTVPFLVGGLGKVREKSDDD